MTDIVLDASGLLALVKNEKGSQIIEPLLGHIIMSSVNVSEAAAILMASSMTIAECQRCILPLLSEIVLFDNNQAFIAASLRILTKHKSLSLGDRACIALGIERQLPIYTADKIWGDLKIPGADIILIR